MGRSLGIVVEGKRNNVSIKNCTFNVVEDLHDNKAVAIYINSQLSLDHLEIDGCTFLNVPTALYMVNSMSEVIVSNCLFKRCGKVDVAHPIEFHWNNGVGAKLKCIGNVFEDCANHPVFEKKIATVIDEVDRIVATSIQHDHHVLEDNKIKGNDKCKNQTFD